MCVGIIFAVCLHLRFIHFRWTVWATQNEKVIVLPSSARAVVVPPTHPNMPTWLLKQTTPTIAPRPLLLARLIIDTMLVMAAPVAATATATAAAAVQSMSMLGIIANVAI